MASIAFYIAVLGATTVGVYLILDALGRAWSGNEPHRLYRMLSRTGASTPRFRASPERELAEARCGGCRKGEECRRWLSTGGSGEGYREFCPNAEFIASLKRMPRR
jgi:hypothetical protein